MTVAADGPVVFDPLEAAFARDPYPLYAALRERGTPHHYAPEDTWMLTRAADVEAVATDRSMVRTRDDLTEAERKDQQRRMNWHDMPHHERFVQINLLESEGATHARLRKLVFGEFLPAVLRGHERAIGIFVEELIDDLIDRPEIDFVGDFAAHVPGHVIGHILGVPAEDRPLLRFWSEEVVRFFDVGRDADGKARAEAATKDFHLYLVALLKRREDAPRDDLLTRLLHHRREGRMSGDEVIATAMLILMAGHGPTIDVLGSGMHCLLKYPDEGRRLRRDPGLMKTAVQEMFRFEAPLSYFHRFATRDCEIGGRHFAAGTGFGLLYGAANRDPARFENPDRFDVARVPNRHVAFGGGAHFCLGNHLARLDMEVIFAALHRRFRAIELVRENPEYKRGLSVRGPVSLEIAWHPA